MYRPKGIEFRHLHAFMQITSTFFIAETLILARYSTSVYGKESNNRTYSCEEIRDQLDIVKNQIGKPVDYSVVWIAALFSLVFTVLLIKTVLDLWWRQMAVRNMKWWQRSHVKGRVYNVVPRNPSYPRGYRPEDAEEMEEDEEGEGEFHEEYQTAQELSSGSMT